MKVTFTTPFARLTAEVDDREAGYIMQEIINSAVGYEANKKQTPEPPRGGVVTTAPVAPEGPFEDDEGIDMDYRQVPEEPKTEPAVEPKKTLLLAPEKHEPKEEKKTFKGYYGYLYVKCEQCGNQWGLCAKNPIMEAKCNCGHATPLNGMKVMEATCHCCERSIKYRTNIQDKYFQISCHGCKAPINIEYHALKDRYVTM